MRAFHGPFLRDEAAHLLRRAAFAATPAAVDRAVADGLDATVERLLAPSVDAVADRRDADLRRSDEPHAVAAAWLARAATTPDPLGESLVLFWHDHFVSALAKVGEPRMMFDQFALFRAAGRGSFVALTQAVARDPAMVRYLDLERTTKDAPNENFARELLELFTTGPGPYGERDVKEAARAFTGYGLRAGRFRFVPASHDDGEKTVFGVRGRFGGDDVARLAAERPETATFMARKLARRFVADAPTDAVVAELAAAWTAAGGDVARTLGVLFRAESFYAAEHRRAVVRCPASFVVGALRAGGVAAPPSPADLARRTLAMGRAIGDPPSVKGYPGGDAWRHPAARLARLDFLAHLVEVEGARLSPPSLTTRDDLAAFARDVAGAAPTAAEQDAIVAAVKNDDPARDRRRFGLLMARPECDRC